jgi:predicted ribosomally synthesized peptide with SipW-like signal peptide
MGRQTLRITIVLGMLVTLLGGTGIFASFTDRATSGDNNVTTGERPRAADLQIATYDPSGAPAGTTFCLPATTLFDDDTTTGQFSAGSLQPGENLQYAYLCLRNHGSATLDVTASSIDVVDADVDCTGDEAVAGDATCGIDQATGLPQAGELSPLLQFTIDVVDCSDPGTVIVPGDSLTLAQWDMSPIQFTAPPTGGPLLPDAVACLRLGGSYPTPAEDVAQRAQTDQATWKFAFDGTAE